MFAGNITAKADNIAMLNDHVGYDPFKSKFPVKLFQYKVELFDVSH